MTAVYDATDGRVVMLYMSEKINSLRLILKGNISYAAFCAVWVTTICKGPFCENLSMNG